ncbi:AAA family ATPase [Chitinimonas sp. JJ19]|uniref:AAA family ATPase n=1 Tax=Chitinimonas sp. JJ19 TaxID=3109352 RepID=UPI003001C972
MALSRMYLRHFALNEAPFSIAPDPRYLYMSQRHQEALAHLLYGLSGDGGFVVLSGEVGAGKTTVCRCLLEQIPASCDLAYVFNPKLTAEELLATLCSEFGIVPPAPDHSIKALVDALNGFLLAGHAQGRHAVVIIDEAQNLSAEVLEQMRLLTNLETNERKLLQIILVGQPELDEMLARPALRQLAQRVVARYHLAALSRAEVAAYVRHRLQVAGCNRPLFADSLMTTLYRLSGGVPRLVNLLCDRALLGAYTEGKQTVSRRILVRAASEVLPLAHKRAGPRWWPWAGVATLGLAGLGLKLLFTAQQAALPEVPAPVPAAEPAAAAVSKKTPLVVATPPVAKPSPPPARVLPDLSWPDEAARLQATDTAFAGLYQAWGQDYNPTERCPKVAALRCRNARGGLEELRQFDRPAVLYLVDATEREVPALLQSMDAQSVGLLIAGQPQRISHVELAQYWSGRYTLLWRAPDAPPGAVRLGDGGPLVAWLARQLDALEHRSSTPPVFDEALRARVKQFQLAQGLAPDGQVGAQTLVRLSLVGDMAAPSLSGRN